MRLLLPTLALLATARLATAQTQIIEPKDPAGTPIRQAVKTLMTAIASDDDAAARAAFAGKDDDLKLFEAFLKSSRAASKFRAALAAKFTLPDRLVDDLTLAKSELRSIDVQTIALDSAKPNDASVSPGNFPTCGYELSRVDGKWLVTSLTSLPDRRAPLTALHEAFANAFDDIATRVSRGDFPTLNDALAAVRAKTDPAMKTYTGKRPSPPTTRPR